MSLLLNINRRRSVIADPTAGAAGNQHPGETRPIYPVSG